MNDYPGCWDCIHNEDQWWYVTHDFTQVCHHDPHPSNIDDVREQDAACKYYEPEK